MHLKSLKKTALWSVLPAMGSAIIASSLPAPQAMAGPAPMMETMAPAPAWKWALSFDYMYRDVDRNEDYWSGDELWNVDYDDYDGDLWGFTAAVTPPCAWDITIDFAYRTGDLEGDFRNFSLEPDSNDPGPYEGKAKFDRDEYVVGLTFPCPTYDWLFARVEYFNYQEDGRWDYGDGYTEAQDYTLWGVTAGVGAKHDMPLGGSGLMLDLNAFAGLVYFDFEHEEVGGPTTDWSGWGFQGRAGARVSYPIQNQLSVFLGTGYEILLTDDGSLDMTTQGVFVNLGLMGEF